MHPLESPHRSGFNGFSQSMFITEIRKNSIQSYIYDSIYVFSKLIACLETDSLWGITLRPRLPRIATN